MRSAVAFASGAYAAAGPLIFLLAYALRGTERLVPPAVFPWLVLLAAITTSAGGIVLMAKPRTGKLLATIGSASAFALTFDHLRSAPMVALSVLLPAIAALGVLWMFREEHVTAFPPVGHRASPPPLGARARAANIVAAAAYGLVILTPLDPTDRNIGAIGACTFIGCALALHSVLVMPPAAARRRLVIWVVILGGVGLGIARVWGRWSECLMVASLIPVAGLLVAPSDEKSALEEAHWGALVLDHPARLLVFTFMGLCTTGTLLLSLPVSVAAGHHVSFIDAAFTAVSAVCVTGLTVKDTGHDFSLFGQWVILVHLQLGGLGIMSFSTAAMRALGKRLSLRHEAAVAGLMSSEDRSRLFSSIRHLLVLTFGFEALGALILTLCFWSNGTGILHSAWHGLFTAISAFCNAGFGLETESLVIFQNHPLILYTVGGLIILGGLSPATLLATPDILKSGKGATQHKIALTATCVLILGGALWIGANEWTNTLSGLSWPNRVHNAIFQSITLRTAAFHSVNIVQAHAATITVMMVCMFIGGSPGGTAGGIKTTTAAVLSLAVVSTIRGRYEASAFKRVVSHRTVYRAAAIATLGIVTVGVALAGLQITQRIPTKLLLFEVFSALGTVGLTIGATPLLDEIGKTLIMACMFAGRVGPLTLFMFLSNRTRAETWKRPTEEIDVG